jgi:hypothetical protein
VRQPFHRVHQRPTTLLEHCVCVNDEGPSREGVAERARAQANVCARRR